MKKRISIAEIKTLYPNEWVLLGNPVMDESKLEVVEGIPLFHSKDKKEVCYIGREKTKDFDKITLIYTGEFTNKQRILTQLKNGTLTKYSSFEELKADRKPAKNMEEALRRHEEFKELIHFFQSKRVDKSTLNQDEK